MIQDKDFAEAKTWMDTHDGECRSFKRFIGAMCVVAVSIIGWLFVQTVAINAKQEAMVIRLDEHGRSFSTLIQDNADREARLQKHIDEIRSDIKVLLQAQGQKR